jgi:hypothetical protein
VEKSIGVDPTPVFDRDSAENNDIINEEGSQRRVSFEGVHTGTQTERASADSALADLYASKENITLETQFPGYSMDGYLVGYNSTFEQNRAFGSTEGSHRYRVEFVEGQRA